MEGSRLLLCVTKGLLDREVAHPHFHSLLERNTNNHSNKTLLFGVGRKTRHLELQKGGMGRCSVNRAGEIEVGNGQVHHR